MIIGIDSALLYESYGRGAKTFFGTFRGFKEYNYSVRPFLESKINEEYGDFWTNIYDDKLIINILKKMHTKNLNYKRRREVPYFNPINLELINKIAKKL